MSLSDVLTRTRHILLDFDGPMCSTFSAISSADATRQLGDVLHGKGLRVPDYLLDTADPFALLYYVAANAPDLGLTAHSALISLEVAGVKTAHQTPGLLDLLAAARQADCTVTVVSNNSEAAVQAFVETEGLSGYLNGVSARTESDPRLLKPHPHLLLRAAAALRAEPSACVLIGDSVTDVEAAHRAGTSSIAFANRSDKRNSLLAAGPDAVVSSLHDVTAALTTS